MSLVIMPGPVVEVDLTPNITQKYEMDGATDAILHGECDSVITGSSAQFTIYIVLDVNSMVNNDGIFGVYDATSGYSFFLSWKNTYWMLRTVESASHYNANSATFPTPLGLFAMCMVVDMTQGTELNRATLITTSSTYSFGSGNIKPIDANAGPLGFNSIGAGLLTYSISADLLHRELFNEALSTAECQQLMGDGTVSNWRPGRGLIDDSRIHLQGHADTDPDGGSEWDIVDNMGNVSGGASIGKPNKASI